MNARPRTAYITGGASGIGRALTRHLLSKGYHVFIADRRLISAEELTEQYNTSGATLHHGTCDTADWSSQLSSFQNALKVLGGRIDTVFPVAGISEKKWLPSPEQSQAMGEGEFAKPDLSVVDVDLTGVLYTVALAVQHFRRQEAGTQGKGKIGLVASVCGLYCVPSLPIYTAAKHALIGVTRSYGSLLRDEGITINAVAPNVVRTGISSVEFYAKLESAGLLTPMEGLMSAFDEMLEGDESGVVYECGSKGGWTKRKGVEYLDEEAGKCCEMLTERGKKLHYDS